MFFHTSAATVGMMKNGEMTRMRTIPCPIDRLVEQQAEEDAADHGDRQHRDGEDQRVAEGLEERRVGEEVVVVRPAGEAAVDRVEQIVGLERVPERQRQRHDHPDEEDHHRRRQHRARQFARIRGRHVSPPLVSPRRRCGRRLPSSSPLRVFPVARRTGCSCCAETLPRKS